jgi:hypothetical protein
MDRAMQKEGSMDGMDIHIEESQVGTDIAVLPFNASFSYKPWERDQRTTVENGKAIKIMCAATRLERENNTRSTKEWPRTVISLAACQFCAKDMIKLKTAELLH